MANKKKHLKKNLLDTFNEKQTKGNVENTLLKGTVDTVAGSVVGTGIGALTGRKASFVGIALMLAGHYIGDQSGLLRITGASTMAYGIGKAGEYKNNPELSSSTKRLSSLKDDWLTAFHLKWKKETNQSVEGTPEDKESESKQKEENQITPELTPLSESAFPDLSVLDQFEKINEGFSTSLDDKKEDQESDDELEEEFDDEEDFDDEEGFKEELQDDIQDEIDELLGGDFDLSLV